MFVAEPSSDRLLGDCVYCIRTTTKAVTASNIAAELFFGLAKLPSNGAAPGGGAVGASQAPPPPTGVYPGTPP